MAFTGAFEVTQSQSDPSSITLTDTSTGTDSNITTRRIYVIKYDQTYLVTEGTTTDYMEWPIEDGIGDTITLTEIFDKDYAVEILVEWVTSVVDPDNTYTAENLFDFEGYGMQFLGRLTTEDSARYPKIVNDVNYRLNKLQFYDYMIQARIAVGLIQDISKGQLNLDEAYKMRLKESIYF
jgi:hypothetical protein